MKHYVINGGGMVGASAALALAISGERVTLIDAQPATQTSDDWDLRISSVNDNHWQWLLSLGIGDDLNHKRMSYQRLSVKTISGTQLSFSAAEAGAEQLGVMVENNNLQTALWKSCQRHAAIKFKAPAQIAEFDLPNQRLTLDDGEQLDYDLLIGADGANSAVARAAAIGYRGWDYGQRCLLANVTLEQPIEAETWEVFRPQGPYALLPLSPHNACLIDYRSSAEIKSISGDADTLIAELRKTFGNVIGNFQLQRYASFPLQRKHALDYHKGDSLILMGDAAHTIHPLAGQGVNLGFADVRSWLACGQNVKRYQQQRQQQNARMMRAMDLVNVGFRKSSKPINWLLKGGFSVIQNTALKSLLLGSAMQR
ncbi:MAG: FAD-dependent monooxygenase [Pseudomonadota bacterium]